ncbi:hypothetical protein LJC74_08465 [Eubacteriales bacterium OttesenSCG-928-A19]|nr:hypothetical protein [Eubacteriales bacterium OttesenSCG-928-A19]
MKKNNRGYSINFATNTITMTQKFENAANEIGSEEYNLLQRLRKDFPKMTIVERSPKKASKKAQVGYRQMATYIDALPNSAPLMAQFEEVKAFAKSQNSPASFTKKWFFATYPDFFKMPTFDNNGKVIYTIKPEAGNEVISEAEAKAAAGE